MRSGFKTRHFLATALLGLLLSFQNCAQAPDPALSDTSQSSYQSSLPFAYKAQIDTISYMSCADVDPSVIEPRAYYSYRAGSYTPGTSGLTMTDEYRTATQHYSNTERGQALSGSDLNSGARWTLSIRDGLNYQSPFNGDTTAPNIPTYDYDSFLPQLDSVDVAGQLASTTQGQMLNYFPGSGDKRLAEASLRFFKSKSAMDTARSQLVSGALLVAGYSATNDPTSTDLRAPIEASTKAVYGTGYNIAFTLSWNSAGGVFSGGEARALRLVQEKDLLTGATVSSPGWECSSAYHFMIVQRKDAAAVGCSTTVDVIPATTPTLRATQTKALEAIRRVLRVEDWYVDLSHHCVVPKDTIADACYGKIGTRTIQYNATTCQEDLSNTAITTMCPHYVSVCIRN